MTREPQSPLCLPIGGRQPVFDLPQRVRLVDRSDLGCVLVNCAVDAAAVAAACSQALGVSLPVEPGSTSPSPRGTAAWLTPRSWLVQCRVDDEEELADAVNRAFPDKTVHAALYSDALAWLELDGPAAWDLLTEGAFVTLELPSFAVGWSKRTLVAGIPAIVLRTGDRRWQLGVERSRARYFAQRLGAVASTIAALPGP